LVKVIFHFGTVTVVKEACLYAQVMHAVACHCYISETVFQDKRKEADAVSRAGLPLLSSVIATVRRRII